MIGKKIKKNNLKIYLNILYAKKEKLYPAYVSKHKSNREKQVDIQFEIFLLTPIGDRWHYLAIKKLAALLRGITSKYHCDFFCLNCLHSSSEKANANIVKKYVKINIFVTFQYLLMILKY